MELTEKNFLLYAAKYYDNPHCVDEEEFYDDLNHLKYLKRLLNKYHKKDQINDKMVRLILNHIIIITNLFGVRPGVEIIFFKMGEEHYSILKPFLIYLGMLPKKVLDINTNRDIIEDQLIKEILEDY